MAAIMRRLEVLKLIRQGMTGREIAAWLGVHESVVSRDRRRLRFMQWRPELRDALIYATVAQVDRLHTGSMMFPSLPRSREEIEAVLNVPAPDPPAVQVPALTDKSAKTPVRTQARPTTALDSISRQDTGENSMPGAAVDWGKGWASQDRAG